jgi:hypothetical protein
MCSATDLILFGAFDRHNFGDMLFAHIAKRLIDEARPGTHTTFAGLAARDLRAYGGHEVAALSSLPKDPSVAILHVGGEILTCGAWEAAVMLTSPDEAQACIARHGGDAGWPRAMLGTETKTPYVVGRETFPQANAICFDAVGGVSLDPGDKELLTKLRTADDISVRDAQTQAALKSAGIEARLAPDPVSLAAELFDTRNQPRHACLAVQFSADYGDDATLRRIASQLDAIGLPIVLFRAGAAPWHDDIGVYERLRSHMRRADTSIFESLNIWDIYALIANSAGYAGSSLHGRVVAMAHGLPRVNLLHPDTHKQSAYAATWDRSQAVDIDNLSDAINDSMKTNREDLEQQAKEIARLYRANFAQTLDALMRK